jgi:hypothetical protein
MAGEEQHQVSEAIRLGDEAPKIRKKNHTGISKKH